MNHMEVDTKKTGYNGGDITIITGAGAHENDETAAQFASRRSYDRCWRRTFASST